MASASNAAGSSNNPRSFGSIMRRMNRNRELRLPWLRVETSAAVTLGKKWCGLFLWVDKILEEDVIACDDRPRHLVDNEEWKMKIA
ncbi:Zinc finger GRF-type protein [Arachis hypogaea]|nr:Zinc finger GRF-type protein [Arachis hypogaea]